MLICQNNSKSITNLNWILAHEAKLTKNPPSIFRRFETFHFSKSYSLTCNYFVLGISVFQKTILSSSKCLILWINSRTSWLFHNNCNNTVNSTRGRLRTQTHYQHNFHKDVKHLILTHCTYKGHSDGTIYLGDLDDKVAMVIYQTCR